MLSVYLYFIAVLLLKYIIIFHFIYIDSRTKNEERFLLKCLRDVQRTMIDKKKPIQFPQSLNKLQFDSEIDPKQYKHGSSNIHGDFLKLDTKFVGLIDKVITMDKKMVYRYPTAKQKKTDTEPTVCDENQLRNKQIQHYKTNVLCPKCYSKNHKQHMVMFVYETLKNKKNSKNFRYCNGYETGSMLGCNYSNLEFANNSIVWICTNNKNHTGAVCFGRQCINKLITKQFNKTPITKRTTAKPPSYYYYFFIILLLFYYYFIIILLYSIST